jgi:PAS domain S-box-containing protein
MEQILTLGSGDEWVGEVEDCRRDGSKVWIDARVTRIKNEMGAPLGILGLAHDVSERKRAEAALRASEAEFRTLSEAVPQIVWATRPDGWTIYFNQRWMDYTGLALEESLGHGWNKPFHPEDQQRAWDAWRHATATVGPYSLECRLRRADGVYRWWLIRGVPLRDDTGNVVKWFGTCTDIDDLKRAEAERAEFLARLNLQIERLPLAYLLSGPDFRYTRWNPAAERLFGFTEAEVLGKHPFEVIVLPQSQPQVADIFARLAAGDMNAHDLAENVTRDGRIIVCEWFNTPLVDSAGQVVGCLSLAADITEKRSLEQQLRQSQKMEAVGQLAGGVAHDFNNLLTIISGSSELLLLKMPAGDPSRSLVEEIHRAGERSASLTRQLLVFSRKQVIQPRVLDLDAVVVDAEKLLRRVLGEDVRLETALRPLSGKVKADSGQLEQVLMNLAVNARDAMPTGGRLTIETAEAELSEDYARLHSGVRPGPYILLAVSDTGTGMTAEVKARIFEPFFTTKEAGKGTGLGLAVVHGIVKEAGGHVGVYSEVGRGTTFKVYLPRVNEPTRAGKSPSDIQPARGGTETILLVEDEDGVRALSRHVLQGYGYKVLEAADGNEALRIASRQGPIQLLVTDVVMPGGLGGRHLAERILTLHPRTRVLYVSGYTDDAVVRHGVLEEQVHFLQKPFSPVALAHKVREVLDTPAPNAGTSAGP